MDFPPPLSFAAIPRPAFGTAAQHLDAPRLTTRADRRYMRAAKIAADLLPELPGAGEAIHCRMTGSYDLCSVISAVAKRLPELQHLRIATLCFSRRNLASLCAMLEERKNNPFALTLLVSVFFRDHNRELWGKAVEELTAYPGVAVGAGRNHCKVVTFDLGDGDGLVFEGSANLRSNRNFEQLVVIRDRPLHDWHAVFVDEMVRADDDRPKT